VRRRARSIRQRGSALVGREKRIHAARTQASRHTKERAKNQKTYHLSKENGF